MPKRHLVTETSYCSAAILPTFLQWVSNFLAAAAAVPASPRECIMRQKLAPLSCRRPDICHITCNQISQFLTSSEFLTWSWLLYNNLTRSEILTWSYMHEKCLATPAVSPDEYVRSCKRGTCLGSHPLLKGNRRNRRRGCDHRCIDIDL